MNDQEALKALSTPVGFSVGLLGLSPYPWQAKALESIAMPGTTAVRSPNGGGRSSVVVAASALWWLSMNKRGKVAITTCDSKQLNEQVLPALDTLSKRLPFPRPVRSPYYRMENGTGGRLIAFTTDDASRVEGLHGTPDEPLLWIVDEAKSVSEAIFQGIYRCSYQHLLLASSCGLKKGTFYDTFKNRRGATWCITAGWADCPHIAETKKAEIIDKFGEDHPFTRSCIYGEFMDQDENETFFLTVDEVERCLRNPAPYKPGVRLAFCDFGCGKSENVIVLREGNRYTIEARWKEGNKLEATTKFIQHFRRLSLQPSQITGDASDAEMLGFLAEAGWPINRQGFGNPAYDKDTYSSWSAEAWANWSNQVRKCDLIIPNDPDLISQATTRRRLFNLKGKICAEDKGIMAKKGIPSPDIIDCLAGAASIKELVPMTSTMRDMGDWNILSFVHAKNDEQGEGIWAGTGACAGGLA